jgi:hypothetical protein
MQAAALRPDPPFVDTPTRPGSSCLALDKAFAHFENSRDEVPGFSLDDNDD